MDAAIDYEKYTRHFLIGGFKSEEQEKLKNGRVLVIGAGGLGSPVLMYLSAAGVGHLGVIDNDRVSLSNLHRQILYTSDDIGKMKAIKASDKVKLLNNDCEISVFKEWWSKENAISLAKGYDVIIDCTDNHASRYLTDEVSKKLEIPFIYGAIHDFEGQLSVFNYNGSKSYADVFPKKQAPTDKIVGVIGPLAGVVGSIQAAETIKVLTGIGEVLCNKILFISLKYNRFQIIDLN